LGAFPSAPKKEKDGFSSSCIVHAVARANVNPELPHTISTKSIIARIPPCKAVDTTLNSNPPHAIAEYVKPLLKTVVAALIHVVDELHSNGSL
jgi:hypothetical protein